MVIWAAGPSALLQVQTTDSGSADLTEHVGDGSLMQTLEVNGESVTATVGQQRLERSRSWLLFKFGGAENCLNMLDIAEHV